MPTFPGLSHDQSLEISAILFDLDGVLTPTVDLHIRAWGDTFAEVFDAHGQPRMKLAEYHAALDGRPRFEGVQSLLDTRGLTLPWGADGDVGIDTVIGIGNLKNQRFQSVLHDEGIAPYPGSLALLDALNGSGIALGIVSSSKNAPAVLAAAGIRDRFDTVVDGQVAAREGLAGKPAPDTFVWAAEQLGAAPSHTIVFEDAVSGVAAGAAGRFAETIGVDRGTGAAALLAAGATRVVTDLGDLLA